MDVIAFMKHVLDVIQSKKTGDYSGRSMKMYTAWAS